MRQRKVVLILAILVLIASFTGTTQAADRYVRLKSVEGEVSIYPSDGQRSSDATINTPLMDGDELQTGNGRAELSFRNGITIRVGDSSGLRLNSSYTPMQIDLLQGTLFLDSHLIERFGDELVVRAGETDVILIDEGNIRVDMGNEGSVRVTTIEGQAEVSAQGRRVLVNAGERTYVDPGRDPEQPERIAGGTDELDEWNESRMDYYARGDFGGGPNEGYVDEDIYYDAYDLGGYGDWRYDGSYGNVWVPHQGYGWRPYNDGRWSYTNGGWFWVSYEPWGWAPYHYGNWGWSFDFGWYWIPGNVFAPAWVSWYSYGDYVGWCPSNFYGYPNYYNHYPRIFKEKNGDVSNPWTFVKKDDLGVTDIKKKVLDQATARQIKIDRNKVSSSPKRELVSYVLPKTKPVPGLVNDKKLIREPGDIKSPVGVKNHEEQIQKKLKGGSVDPQKGSTNTKKANKIDRAYEKPRDVKTLPGRPAEPKKEYSKPAPERPAEPRKDSLKSEKRFDRDLQFKRNESSRPYHSLYSNPYYRDRNKNFEGYDRRRDVSPKYFDEAKKYFERFDNKSRSGETDRSAPRTYEPPGRSYETPKGKYESPKKSYEAPKRSYEAPKKDYNRSNSSSSRSNSSSSRSNKSSSSNNNNRKHN